MITLIHGSDTAFSRKYFLAEKQKFADATILNAEQINLTDLTQLFDGGGLFGEVKYIFIEELFAKQKKNPNFKDILKYLERKAEDNDIYLWEGKDLEQTTLKQFKNALIKPFKLPQTLFQLLDAVKPGNGKILIKLFHQTITTTEPEMIFFMLVRQFRILLALTNTNKQTSDSIDELKRLAPWQKAKLEKQTKMFDITRLLDLHKKLFQIEINQKTGNLTNSLISAIDFFLLEV